MNINKISSILSPKEIEVVNKRLNNKHLTQTESNYLSRSIRPKLKSAEFAASIELLSLLDYRRKKFERKDTVLRNQILNAAKRIENQIKAVILFGSYVRNKHTNYRDIDILIILKNKIWKNAAEKQIIEKQIEKSLEKTDINLVVYKDLMKILPYSPLLHTELEDHKIIYGNIDLKKSIRIDKQYLLKKLLEIESIIELGKNLDTKYLYNALRTVISIDLFLKKVINNKKIIKTIEDNIGKNTANNLIENKANSLQKEIAIKYLKYLYDSTLIQLQ